MQQGNEGRQPARKDSQTMEKVKITIIVPVYDVEPYIADCLRSVMGQTYGGPIECLVVDDCGHDGSMAAAEKEIAAYGGPVDFRILHHERNMGLSAARNTGLRAATGDYVYFLDSDDEITPDCMEILAAPLSSSRYDFVIGGYRVTGTTRKVPQLSLEDGSTLYGSGIVRAYYDRGWYMMACGKLCNLKFLRDNGLMMKEGLLHEDELWSFEMACTASSMYVVNRESYIYKVRENSITTNALTSGRRITALHDIIRGMTDFVLERGIRDRYAYLKIFNTQNMLWNAISGNPDMGGIALDGRRELSRLPYWRRVMACMTGPGKFVRNAYSILPVSLYNACNRAVTSLKKSV